MKSAYMKQPQLFAEDPGDEVASGTVNATGSFVIRAERVGKDTLLAHIVNMVVEAQRSRAPIQALADTVSGWFVPGVILAALLTFAAFCVVAFVAFFWYLPVATVTLTPRSTPAVKAQQVTSKGSAQVEVASDGSLTIKGATITGQASGALTLKGSSIMLC